jgi:hypothetical protein
MLQMDDRFINFVLASQHIAKAAVGGGETRLDRKYPQICRRRSVQLSLLLQYVSEILLRFDKPRL